jgi:UPF0716 protein FxsA
MPAILVILLVVVPVVELLIVLQVGGWLGVGWTVALLVAASLLGAYLLRIEGARTWQQFRQALEAGRWPGDEVAQGALVLVGGSLLLTPGFLTDIVGFLFLLPPTRKVTARWLRRFVAVAGFRPFVVGSGADRAARAARVARSSGRDDARRPSPRVGSSGADPAGRRPSDRAEPPPAPSIEVVSIERDPVDDVRPADDPGPTDGEDVEVVPDEDLEER